MRRRPRTTSSTRSIATSPCRARLWLTRLGSSSSRSCVTALASRSVTALISASFTTPFSFPGRCRSTFLSRTWIGGSQPGRPHLPPSRARLLDNKSCAVLEAKLSDGLPPNPHASQSSALQLSGSLLRTGPHLRHGIRHLLHERVELRVGAQLIEARIQLERTIIDPAEAERF